MIDRSSPNPGPTAHVFVADPAGDPAVCMCGRPRFTGVHVQYDGTPEANLSGILDALDAIENALAAARRILGGS